MTDGIIQKVFNNYINALQNARFRKLEQDRMIYQLGHIEQELIEKIKQLQNTDSVMRIGMIEIEKLIGDNQE